MTDMTPQQQRPQQQTQWRVTDVQEVSDLAPTGQFVRGQRVSYQLADGATGTVFVPNSQFNEATVRTLVSAAAQRLANVKGLQG